MNKPCEWCIGLFTNDTGTLSNNNNHCGDLANSTIRKVSGLDIKCLGIVHLVPKALFSSRSQTPVWVRQFKAKLLFC